MRCSPQVGVTGNSLHLENQQTLPSNLERRTILFNKSYRSTGGLHSSVEHRAASPPPSGNTGNKNQSNYSVRAKLRLCDNTDVIISRLCDTLFYNVTRLHDTITN